MKVNAAFTFFFEAFAFLIMSTNSTFTMCLHMGDYSDEEYN